MGIEEVIAKNRRGEKLSKEDIKILIEQVDGKRAGPGRTALALNMLDDDLHSVERFMRLALQTAIEASGQSLVAHWDVDMDSYGGFLIEDSEVFTPLGKEFEDTLRDMTALDMARIMMFIRPLDALPPKERRLISARLGEVD